MSSVRYGTWLGDLKNKQSTESHVCGDRLNFTTLFHLIPKSPRVSNSQTSSKANIHAEYRIRQHSGAGGVVSSRAMAAAAVLVKNAQNAAASGKVLLWPLGPPKSPINFVSVRTIKGSPSSLTDP